MAQKSKGTALKLSISSVYTTIGAVKSLKGAKPKVGTFKTTALDSGIGETIGATGFVNSGQVSGTVWYDTASTTHKALLTRIATPTEDDLWKHVFADAGEWAFTGMLTEFGDAKAELNEGVTADFTVEIDGAITFPS